MTQINHPLNKNFYNPAVTNAKKTETATTETFSDDELLSKRTKVALSVLAGLAEEKVPQSGRMRQKTSVNFDIPSTNNVVYMAVEESAENKETNRDISLNVRHKDRDRFTSCYVLLNQPKNKIIEFLRDESNEKDIIKHIKELSASTDEFYATL